MAKQFDAFDDAQRAFIADQPLFFVGTAAQDGRVNVSPKGMDSLRVLGPNRVLWLNYTGSGNETAGHLLAVNRMTLMWCSFGKRPMIMRAYGTARALHARDDDWAGLAAHFDDLDGARQLYDMTVDMVQTSCGYAVPYLDNPRERDTLKQWTQTNGDAGVQRVWEEKNQTTIDGAPTGLLDQ